MIAAPAKLEVWLDKWILEKLSDHSPDIDGMILGRFDQAIRSLRPYVARIYRGVPEEPPRETARGLPVVSSLQE
jgi:hypothetical protein